MAFITRQRSVTSQNVTIDRGDVYLYSLHAFIIVFHICLTQNDRSSIQKRQLLLSVLCPTPSPFPFAFSEEALYVVKLFCHLSAVPD